LANNPSDDLDHELVLHLIASHHGHARPLMPPMHDPEPTTIALDDHIYPSIVPVNFDHADRFHRLCRRYGTWGLALSETILRLAGQWASARNEGA